MQKRMDNEMETAFHGKMRVLAEGNQAPSSTSLVGSDSKSDNNGDINTNKTVIMVNNGSNKRHKRSKSSMQLLRLNKPTSSLHS